MDNIVCKRLENGEEYIKANLIRDSILELIKKDYPHLTKDCYIKKEEVDKYREIHLATLIKRAKSNFNEMDKLVIKSIANRDVISDNIEESLDKELTIGQKIADKVASFGGSWTFILSFTIFLVLWMIANVLILTRKPFDPYPFILLNLLLSTLAAIQAPVIMMSQNRQEEKDRKRGQNDYKINLKSELEIKLLHEKKDHLILSQNKRIMENQEIQNDYLEEILELLKENVNNRRRKNEQ